MSRDNNDEFPLTYYMSDINGMSSSDPYVMSGVEEGETYRLRMYGADIEYGHRVSKRKINTA